MNSCSKALNEIAKVILFENKKAISINSLYTSNSNIYPRLKYLVERFIVSALMVDFFVLRAEITQLSGSYFRLLGVDYVLSLLTK